MPKRPVQLLKSFSAEEYCVDAIRRELSRCKQSHMQIMQCFGVAWRNEERRHWNDEFVLTSPTQTHERCCKTATGGRQQENRSCTLCLSAVSRRWSCKFWLGVLLNLECVPKWYLCLRQPTVSAKTACFQAVQCPSIRRVRSPVRLDRSCYHDERLEQSPWNLPGITH